MIVYRFERNGIGPYVGLSRVPSAGSMRYKRKSTKSAKKLAELHRRLYMQVEDDSFNNWHTAHTQKKYLFGCPSKDHLRAYFGMSFKALFKQGYRIKRYRVPDDKVLHMGIEVAFPVKYHKLQTVNNIKKNSLMY